MTLTLDLPAELETRLRSAAQSRGVAPEEWVKAMLEQNLPLPKTKGANSLAELFAQWEAEDATDDPAEIARRQKEWEELKQAMNENRGSYRKPFP